MPYDVNRKHGIYRVYICDLVRKWIGPIPQLLRPTWVTTTTTAAVLLLLLLVAHTDLCVGFVSHEELCVCVQRMNAVYKV